MIDSVKNLYTECVCELKKKKKKGDYARKCIKSDFEMALYFSVYASKKMRKFSVKLTQGHRYQPDG